MKLSTSDFYSSMHRANCLLLFSVCTFLLLHIRPAASVALNFPVQDVDEDNSVLTNSVVPEAESEHDNTASTHQTPTSSPANCTKKNTTERNYNESAMLDSIRQHFLAKLNLTEAPSPLQAGAKLEIPPDMLSSYYASLQTQQQSEKEPQDCPDKKTTHYSRSVNLYSPDQYVSAQAIPDHFVLGGGDDDDDKKIDDKETSKQTGEPVDPTSSDKDSLPPVLYSLRFDHLDLARASRLWSAVLKLYKRKAIIKSSGIMRGTNPIETVKVFRVVRKSSNGVLKKVYQLFTTKNVRSEDEGYVSFDITEGIKRWQEGLSQHQQSLELDVLIDTPEIVGNGLNLPPVITFDVPTYGKGERRAQMVVETLSNKENSTAVLNNAMQRRRKRQTSTGGGVNSAYCLNNPSEKNCCIREATVNFRRDLGWNWVILPASFKPNYCSGGCQNPRWPSATKSTEFLTRLRQNNPTAAAEPCCVPHELRSITVLMVLNGRVVLNDIPDMIVKSCICR